MLQDGGFVRFPVRSRLHLLDVARCRRQFAHVRLAAEREMIELTNLVGIAARLIRCQFRGTPRRGLAACPGFHGR